MPEAVPDIVKTGRLTDTSKLLHRAPYPDAGGVYALRYCNTSASLACKVNAALYPNDLSAVLLIGADTPLPASGTLEDTVQLGAGDALWGHSPDGTVDFLVIRNKP